MTTREGSTQLHLSETADPCFYTFRFLKQGLGWARPAGRELAETDRWRWMVVSAQTLLLLAHPLATEYCLLW